MTEINTSTRIFPRKPIAERFWPKVKKGSPNECWEWLGVKQKNGYGCIGAGGKYGGMKRAHRVSYEIANGPIPAGLTIDHLCKNRLCVNPRHLEAVTVQENLLRGDTVSSVNARKTHCRNGHPFTGKRNSRGDRVCLTCAAATQRACQARKRAAGYKRPSQATGRPYGARGERNGGAKLTNQTIKEIRAALAVGTLRSVLAKRHSISWTQIDRISKNLSWTSYD